MAEENYGALIQKVRGAISARMAELEPQVGEALWLKRELEIVEYAIEQRDRLQAQIDKLRPPATRENIEAWVKEKDPDDIFRAADLATHFGKSHGWTRAHLKRMLDDDIIERWGLMFYRRKPKRTGTASLHVVTKGA